MLEVVYLPSAQRQINDLIEQDPDLAAEMVESIEFLSQEGMAVLADMPTRYKKLHRAKEFKLYEIVVKQYRTAFAILRVEKERVHIVHVFKKQRMRERQEVKIAIQKARNI